MRRAFILLIFIAVAANCQRLSYPIPSGSGGGGGSSVYAATDLTDCKFSRTDATTLTMAACRVMVGHVLFTFPSTTFVLSATATDTAYIYILNGAGVVGYSDASTTITVSGFSTQSGITAFPAGSKPLAYWPATSTAGAWNTTGADMRTLPQGFAVAEGNGMSVSCSDSTGVCTIAVDTTTVVQFTSSTSDASGSCTTGQVWINTSSDAVWDCTHTDTWTPRGTVTASSTTTFTNKTLDVEGTGNSVTTVDMRSWPAAKCQNGAAGATANLPATYSPTPACITGTNVLTAALTWPDADGDYSIQDSFRLPFDWSGYVNFYLKWRTSATSGDIVWQLSTACVADGETSDPSFNAAQTVTDTAKGTTLQENDASISTITMTGCAAGETLYWKLLRNRTHASDTLAAAADLLSYAFRIRRMQ